MAVVLTLSGCSIAQPIHYSSPEESGLIGVRPFPTPADVCQVIGENARTNPYLDDSATLIGCPTHEIGAIKDRVADGAEMLAVVGDWQLLSTPDR